VVLAVSFGALLIATLLGGGLAAAHLHAAPGRLRGWWLGAVHGVLGVAGFGALLVALRGPPRGVAMGVGSFGASAAVLLAMALIAGLGILVVRLRGRRVGSLVVGVHATVAISGVVVLAAYVLVG
jgi:hypothetical protein